jgi:ABC-type transport system involved in multi-copper enzyme maturation permease subunit
MINRRLLHPPDVGSEGKEVIDEEEEMKYAIGVVIDRDLFPDKLFAPAKRDDLMPDGTNPVLDKELRSEIFSQGTLMLRVVIQVSMLLSIPLMAVLLFLRSDMAAYYVAYVLTFNLLVGPVFSAGSITQERERQTLSLLLTTLLRPGKIVLAKLIAALRVSTVLTFLLTEQLLLAYVLLYELRNRFWTLIVFLLIIVTTCLATSTIGLMCSSLVRRTSTAMVLTYLTLLLLFVVPIGLEQYLQGMSAVTSEQLASLTITSPFAAALSVPMHTLKKDMWTSQDPVVAAPVLIPITSQIALPVWAIFLCIYPPLSLAFLFLTYVTFRWRWWRAGGLG